MSEEQQNQSTGIVGEIVEGLHNLEQKVEHLIHGDGAPSSTEPVAAQEAGTAAPDPIDATASNAAVASGELSSDSTSSDAPEVAASGESSHLAGFDAATTAQAAALPSESDLLTGQTSDAATAGASVDDPNAAAPTAGDPSASGTQSSASPVSQVGVGLAIAASVSEAIASRVYTLRKHFWTFDEATRAPFIKLLDEIEALVK